MDMSELHSRLGKVEFSRLHCTLLCERETHLTLADCLGLRPPLQRTTKALVELGALLHHDAKSLFDPPPFPDPEARRKFQTPAPPFVFRWEPESFKTYTEGEEFHFELLLLGVAVPRLDVYVRVLECLARESFAEAGSFELNEISGLDDSGNSHKVWISGDAMEGLVSPVCTADWWVMQHEAMLEPLTLRLVTPARLMSQGKPLFKPAFLDLLPFMLRRITSLCYAHADVLLLDDVQPVIEDGLDIVSSCRLSWEDWRQPSGQADMELGGLMGDCELSGPGVKQLSWLLSLGELFQVGRGAAYGAGKIELCASLPG